MSKPKDTLAWQKWQPQHFAPQVETVVAPSVEPPSDNEPVPSSLLDAQQEIEAFRTTVHQQAWQEGYAAGVAEGQREGLQQGMTQATEQAHQQQQQALARLSPLIDQLMLSFDLLENTVSTRLVQIALQVAHTLIGETVSQDPQKMMTQVQRLLAEDALLTGPLTLKLNPEDLQLLAEPLATLTPHPRWEVVPDTRLPRGDCRLISQEGELESALSARWQALYDVTQRGAY